ncbi:MAG: DUF4147 domain-containing protein [bacterium]|nr:DUF4147 domain-containing protein [bacterium]
MGQIQNAEALTTGELRRDALGIAEAGFEAVNTKKAIKSKVQVRNGELHIGDKTFNIAGRRVYFVGVGKCAIAAAGAIEKLFGDKLAGGIALDVSASDKDDIMNIETYIGTHPLPSEVNERATERIIEFLSGRTEDDLVIMCISGGGSTLLCLHETPMTCSDEGELFKELTARGAPIQDMNTVRKHISRARGGGLAEASYPAEVVSLIVSDVPGNDLSSIASGPTVLDSSTVADAQAVLARYGMGSANIAFIETPKDEKYFKRVSNILFITNQDALTAMNAKASRLGYSVTVVNDCFTGEARDLGRAIVEKLHASTAKTALLYAGESTVTIAGGLVPTKPTGEGGRNQELALATLEYLNSDELIMPFSSDGRDNTDHAGAIADEQTRIHAREKNISAEEYLDAHRSYDFFTTTGDALVTGYTGSNVSDLIIALKK